MSENSYVIHDSATELARLQLQGTLLNAHIAMLPPLFDPTLRPITRVLDLGCGPGSWVLQVAQTYPEWDVVGVDVNPRMISYAYAQVEVLDVDAHFRVMDILAPLDFEDESFDFVNLRFGIGFLPRSKAPAVLQECFRVLRPGGVFRNTETVHTSTPGQASRSVLALIAQALYLSGFTSHPADMSLSASVAPLLKECGFAPIEIIPYALDASYGSLLYQSMREDMAIVTTLIKPLVVDKLHLCSSEEFEQLARVQADEWADPHFSAHTYMASVIGMKPA